MNKGYRLEKNKDLLCFEIKALLENVTVKKIYKDLCFPIVKEKPASLCYYMQ